MRGVFLDSGSLNPAELDFSAWHALVPDWQWHDTTTPAQVGARIADAHIAISNKVPLDRESLAAARQLRLVCIAATGTDNIDLDAARELGITVCNARGYATPSVVQHVFTLILALRSHLLEYRAVLRAGAWSRSAHFSLLQFPLRELAGSVLGIVGYGELGRAVAGVAQAFGMEVHLASLPGRESSSDTKRLPLAQLLPQVDVLTLHCPLTPQTRGLIDSAALASMRPDAILINTARGGIVDEAALAQALRTGRLGGAGVDVLTAEPPPPDHPLLAADIPNLIVTPHIAWACRESRQRLANAIAANIGAFLTGHPLNVVT